MQSKRMIKEMGDEEREIQKITNGEERLRERQKIKRMIEEDEKIKR